MDGKGYLTQLEIAKATGVSRAMIHHIEKRALRKIKNAIECEAAAAGVTVREWLFGDMGSQTSAANLVMQRFMSALDS